MNEEPGGIGPTVHGFYDYLLGGVQHERADRELGKAVEEEFPAVAAHVRAAKEFHLRAARWCARQGISRFVRAGTVTWQESRNVHEAAREVNAGAEVAYVNESAEAHRWAGTLLAGGPGLTAVHADAGRPAEVLAAPPVAGWVEAGEAVCLILGMFLHFAPAQTAAAIVAGYAGALPGGSVIAVSVSLPDNSPQADRLLSMMPARVYRHTAQDVTGWLEDAGLEIVPPGVRDVRLVPGRVWPRREAAPRAPGLTVGALGAEL